MNKITEWFHMIQLKYLVHRVLTTSDGTETVNDYLFKDRDGYWKWCTDYKDATPVSYFRGRKIMRFLEKQDIKDSPYYKEGMKVTTGLVSLQDVEFVNYAQHGE